MQHVRLDHDPQRQLLQVRELRDDERLRVGSLPRRSAPLKHAREGGAFVVGARVRSVGCELGSANSVVSGFSRTPRGRRKPAFCLDTRVGGRC